VQEFWLFHSVQTGYGAHPVSYQMGTGDYFSIPYWTTSVFSSTVTDLVLIYESVASSASTAEHWTLLRLAYDWIVHSRVAAYCRWPASKVTPGIEPCWDPWPYICSMLRLLFFFSFFRCSSFDKKGGVGLFYIWCSLTTPFSTRGRARVTHCYIASGLTARNTRPLPNNGRLLSSRIVVGITLATVFFYQESVSAGACLSSRCLAIDLYFTICYFHKLQW
jgi:hypothetical protein